MAQISAEDFFKTPADELMSRFIASNQPLLVKGLLQKTMSGSNLVSLIVFSGSIQSIGHSASCWVAEQLSNESLGAKRVVE